MNKQLVKICGSALLLASVGVSALAQAQGLGGVIEQAQETTAAQNALYQQRANEYNAMSDAAKQTAMQQANASRAAVQAQVDAKTQQYSDNDLRINTQLTELRDKASSLGVAEIFGQARQYAADLVTPFEQSLIQAQFASDNDSRTAFFESLAGSDRMLTTAQLERLWIEMSRELAAQGEVARYNGTVIEPNGTPRTAEVVRIGPFTAIADGEFLAYIPELASLNTMPRQPEEGDLMARAAALQSATTGYVDAVVDSTRGVLLGMYVERPTLWERIDNGEMVNFVIIIVGAIGLIAWIFQVLYLAMARIGVSGQLRNLQNPKRNNPLGRVLLAFKGDMNKIEENADAAELRISEAVMREVPKLERFQALLRLVVAAGPLLGLVGTVSGMIITFQAITEAGSSDPKLMAEGIGAAMIATLLGLGIAVPTLFMNALLSSLSRSIVQILDEQSTGILAENIEKRKNG